MSIISSKFPLQTLRTNKRFARGDDWKSILSMENKAKTCHSLILCKENCEFKAKLTLQLGEPERCSGRIKNFFIKQKVCFIKVYMCENPFMAY